MADEQQVARVREGAVVWNAWVRQHPEVRADLRDASLYHEKLSGVALSGADLRHADLHGVDLSSADLSGADLEGANLNRADLNRAKLRDANLKRAKLNEVDLRFADLNGAFLRMAELSEADLRYAKLNQADLGSTELGGANLSGAQLKFAYLKARLGATVFGNVDLRDCEGLDKCLHHGPSSLDYLTLLRSGPLPLSFLRGCGLSDRFIEYLPSLLDAGPIQFYSCFISYSTRNQDFADRLHADLQAKGVRCWFAPHDLQPGKKIHEQIDEAIRLYDRLLLILSTESMSSRWVKTEIAQARQKELSQGRRVLFPISLVPFEEVRTWQQFDADLGDDAAKEIREYYLPDFSGWKAQDAYQPVFERLLAALKGEG